MEAGDKEEPNYESETLALRIVAKEQNLTQRDMAEICKVSHVSISRMLKGHQRVTVDVIKALCFAFGYLPEFFLKQGNMSFAFQTEKQNVIEKRVNDDPTDTDNIKLDLEILMVKYRMLELKVNEMEQHIQVLFNRIP